MGGDNPVFVTDAFNVGLDEYNSAYKEDMTQYTQYVMDLVYNKYGKNANGMGFYGMCRF